MVASMTGFGRGEAEADGLHVSVELRSVNGRYGDVFVHMPRTLAGLEARVKDLVLSTFSRGRVDVTISVQGEGSEQGVPVLNRTVADAYADELKALAKETGAAGDLDLMRLALLPNVFSFESKTPEDDAVWNALEPACHAALTECDKMRRVEGQKLADDMVARVKRMDAHVDDVEKRSPDRVDAARQRLQQKLEQLLGADQVDESRLLTEIAVLADRYDITEECVRFRSHNGQFLEALKSSDAVGRRLNFLLQEMLREANTIGSKANDADIAHVVVAMKEEIEKVKEQVQNIE
jgi:uncharacterized protein (TIGR00255 family)